MNRKAFKSILVHVLLLAWALLSVKCDDEYLDIAAITNDDNITIEDGAQVNISDTTGVDGVDAIELPDLSINDTDAFILPSGPSSNITDDYYPVFTLNNKTAFTNSEEMPTFASLPDYDYGSDFIPDLFTGDFPDSVDLPVMPPIVPISMDDYPVRPPIVPISMDDYPVRPPIVPISMDDYPVGPPYWNDPYPSPGPEIIREYHYFHMMMPDGTLLNLNSPTPIGYPSTIRQTTSRPNGLRRTTSRNNRRRTRSPRRIPTRRNQRRNGNMQMAPSKRTVAQRGIPNRTTRRSQPTRNRQTTRSNRRS